MLRLIVFCMLAVLVAGFMPSTATAQGDADASPVVRIEIRDISLFLSNVERLNC
jgi:hypothetical protein